MGSNIKNRVRFKIIVAVKLIVQYQIMLMNLSMTIWKSSLRNSLFTVTTVHDPHHPSLTMHAE